MRSLFVEDSVDMGRELGTAGTDAAAEIRDAVSGRYVCPFCGAVREQADGICPRCTMESTAATRQATKSRIGPWYVLQTRNPAAPGMRFETLLAFIAKGRVKARSIVRGPTTHQLWRFAAHVKGLSREFGVCYSCGEPISKSASLCSHCNRPQDPPANPDVFLESAEQDRMVIAPPAPVYREIGATPMVAEDPLAPAEGAHAKAAPADPKPMPKGPDPRLLKKGADGFLTAADLAAAFKLDFQQPKGRKQKKTSVAPIGMDRESPDGGHPRRKRRWFRAVLLLLLAASIGVAAYQYRRDPVFHARADRWYAMTLVWTQQKWVEVKQAANKMREQPAAKPKTNGQNPMIVLPATTDPSQDSQSPQTTQPGAKPSPWDRIYAQPTPAGTSTAPAHPAKVESQPANDTPTSSITIEPPPSHPVRDGGIDDVRTLYRAAIEADGQGDYTTAVKKYEQIKEFSKDLWPRDLELRLKTAREQIR
jgi:hypothetical protein